MKNGLNPNIPNGRYMVDNGSKKKLWKNQMNLLWTFDGDLKIIFLEIFINYGFFEDLKKSKKLGTRVC